MWIQVILVLTIIELSLQECNKTTHTLPKHRFYSDYFEYYEEENSTVSCEHITASYDLHSDISSNMDNSVESVTISKSSIPKLHQDLFRNINLKYLKIQANVGIVESKAFETSNISSITLDFNDIKTIGDGSFDSSLIQSLSLKNNSLSEINRNNFLGLTSLKKLNLKYNRIRAIADHSFDALSTLEELDLSYNKLVDLHYHLFEEMILLKSIFLNDNFLKAVHDDTFSKCKSLELLYIQNNDITKINTRNYPASLTHINASHNQLMLGWFFNLVNLSSIDVSFNKLIHIDKFENLPALTYLYLNYNLLYPLISSNRLNSFHKLFVLELSGNGLKQFNFETLNNLTELNRLNLATNNLTHLDFTHFRTHVDSLNLSGNSLIDIKNLTIMQNMKQLDLNYNNLQEVKYDTFGNMSNLKELYLGYNSIHTLHMGCFRGLKKLYILHLCHNKITNIEIGTFAGTDELDLLDVSHNYLSHLDEYIFSNFRSLVVLDVSYNNLNSLEVKKALKHVDGNLVINLVGSTNWNCKSLIDIVKNGKRIQLAEGTFYNVTNIHGIPCNNTDDSEQPESSENMALYLNSIEQNSKEISSKTSAFNFFMAVLLLALFLELFSGECSTLVKRYIYNRY